MIHRDVPFTCLDDPCDTPLCAWDLVERNALLPAGVKFAGEVGALRLRADLWNEDACWLEAWSESARRGFEVATHIARVDSEAPAPGASQPATGEGDRELEACCAQAGWSSTRRGDGQLAIDLEVPGALVEALALVSADAALALRVEQTLCPFPDPSCRDALAALLLRACAAYRLVRIGVLDAVVRYEVTPLPPGPAAVHAIAALALALRGCFHEVEVVSQNVRVARLLAGRDAVRTP